MERGEWENDPEYPKAPLPAHERVWRHPSEIGANQWASSEPPLVVGRGLSMATGAVGAALAVGLLWLMIPHHSRSGVSAAGSVTSNRSTENNDGDFRSPGAAIPNPSTLSTEFVATTDVDPSAITTIATTPASSVPTANSSDPVSMATLLLDPKNASADIQATAVALVPGHFVITTARAVRDRQSIEVILPSGDIVVGAVISVDKNAGTAVLSLPSEIEASVVELSAETAQTSGVIMMSPTPLTVSVAADDSGIHLLYDRDVMPGEGALVLDRQGHLLGMCTISKLGVTLVSVDAMLGALDDAATIAAPAWLGIQPDTTVAGEVSVGAVVSDGPAAVAGVKAGDVIKTIDGLPIENLEELGQAIAAHAAGDSVTLTLTRSPTSAPVSLTITFSRHPESM